MRKLLKHLLLVALDLQSLVFATFIAIFFFPEVASLSALGAGGIIFPALLYLSHLSLGLYESKLRDSVRGVLRRLIVSVALTILATEVIVYVAGFTFSLVIWLPIIAMQILGHWAARYWLFYHRGVGISRRKVLVIGAGRRAAYIATRMRRARDRINISSLCFVALKNDDYDAFSQEIVICEPACWKTYLADNRPDIIVMASDPGGELPVMELLTLKLDGVDVVELEDFAEAELGQIALEQIKPEWLLSSSGFKKEVRGAEVLDAIFNKGIALLMLLILWPIMLLTALAIYFDDGRRDKASVLYRQIRVGKNGRNFEILKFRSMGKHAEKAGAQWAVADDVRVTRIGAALRKYRLDELPQLINVLRGDMCFVGPRPERPEFVEMITKEHPYFPLRHAVTPGLTGWAQLKYPYGASMKDSFEKLKFDLYYIKHRSLLLDLFTLIRTVEIVIFGRGR